MSHSQPKPSEPSPESVAAHHELTDANAHSLVIFTLALAGTLIVIVVVTLFLFKLFKGNVDLSEESQYAGSPLSALQPPSPAPPLQPSLGSKDNPLHETLPFQDAAALKAEYDRIAGTYGSEMMADHKVHSHMPVKDAIQLLAEEGIPANTATDIPTPLGSGASGPMPFSDGGRGSSTGKAAAPGVPPPQN